VSDQSSPATPAPALPPPSDRLSRVLSTITAQARRTNLTRTADLGAALDDAAGRGLDAAGWAAAERTAHQLAGSAGTFGFAGVSEIARSLERFFAESGAAGSSDPVRLAEARSLLSRASDQLTDEGEPS
jgi:HPt (histidine-containing phosphotransfer) domain-containing protein